MASPIKKVNVSTEGETSIVITRSFNAPRELVFDAHTKPELVKRWLLGPEGWTMPVCEIDLRVGGKYRYVWKKESTGHEMGMGGEYREINCPERLVATEKFDDPWYEGEAYSTLTLTETNGVTQLRNVVTYATGEARDGVLKSPMEEGLEVGYERLEALLTESAQASGSTE
jgi:uncharacterized protein YndB with AHSA1/START domain